MRRIRWSLFVAAVCGSLALLAPDAALAGDVVPGSAHPLGWSLDQMAVAAAQFNASGNNQAYYPSTPFQLLYADPGTVQLQFLNGGAEVTGSNTFSIPTGTWMYVPVWSADDSPPIVGTWPLTHQDAIGYFFDPSQLGGQGLSVTVDGVSTPLDGSYIAGPVTTPPLPDGGGTQIVTLGAFVHPLRTGVHTISISGGLFGSDIASTYELSFFEESYTYTVNVR